MSVKAQDILNQFTEQLQHLSGPLEAQIELASSWENPKTNCVIYALNDKALKAALESSASLVICDKELSEKIPKDSQQCVFLASDLQSSMAEINSYFFAPKFETRKFDGESIHPSAVISNNAQLASTVIVGPNATIEEGAKIGEKCFIGANTYIGKNVIIGDGTIIEANVYVGPSCEMGKDCRIQALTAIGSDGYGYATNKLGQHKFKPHFGKVILADRVEIGANVSVDRGAYDDSTIGEGTKIDNHCHFGHNIVLGKHCFVTAGFISAGSAKIGDHCVFGGRSSVNGHIKIISQSIFSGLTAVTKDVTKPGIYGGYPFQPIKDSLKTLTSLKHIPELRRTVKKILEKVKIDD